MKVKGTGVASTINFVLANFGEDACEAWLASLPEETQHIMRYALSSSWYPIEEMQLVPGRRLCEMFYPEDVKTGARLWGAFAAQRELTGIYKVLLKIGSPRSMIAVAGTTWKTFYSGGAFDTIINEKGYAILRTRDASIPEPLWGHHTAGWLGKALFLAGGKDGSVSVAPPKNSDRTDDFEFAITWH